MSAVKEKSADFAVRIVEMYKYLSESKREYVISKQMLRSGTSIGANVHEGEYAQSKADFLSKMSIALKEAAETEYWLGLLSRTGYIGVKQYDSMSGDCVELIKLLTSITKSTKINLN